MATATTRQTRPAPTATIDTARPRSSGAAIPQAHPDGPSGDPQIKKLVRKLEAAKVKKDRASDAYYDAKAELGAQMDEADNKYSDLLGKLQDAMVPHLSYNVGYHGAAAAVIDRGVVYCLKRKTQLVGPAFLELEILDSTAPPS